MTEKDTKKLGEEQIEQVSGGSWNITEANGKKAGLSLRYDDGTEGEWGYLWNSGDYYWRGQKLSIYEAEAIVTFTNHCGRQPDSVAMAVDYYERLDNANNPHR